MGSFGVCVLAAPLDVFKRGISGYRYHGDASGEGGRESYIGEAGGLPVRQFEGNDPYTGRSASASGTTGARPLALGY